MNAQTHVPDTQERQAAERVLGADASYHHVVRTHHPITRWEAQRRKIVTKCYRTEKAYRTELKIFECLEETGCRFVPKLLAHDKPIIAMDWMPGEQFIDRFDPFDLVGQGNVFVEAAEAIAGFQMAGATRRRRSSEP